MKMQYLLWNLAIILIYPLSDYVKNFNQDPDTCSFYVRRKNVEPNAEPNAGASVEPSPHVGANEQGQMLMLNQMNIARMSRMLSIT